MVSREGALRALYYLSMADGEVSPEEVSRFGEMAESLGVGGSADAVAASCAGIVGTTSDEDEAYDRIAEGLDEALRGTGDVPERMLLWNLLALSFTDGDRSPRETRLIRHVVRTRGIGEDVFLEMEALMASAADVSRELEAVKASSMPYAKAHARVESLQERLDAIRSAALLLIGDETDPVPEPEPVPERPVDPVAAAVGAVGDAGAAAVNAVGEAGAAVAQTVGGAVAPVLGDAQKGLADAGAAVADAGKQAMDGLADMGKQAAGFIGGLFGGKR